MWTSIAYIATTTIWLAAAGQASAGTTSLPSVYLIDYSADHLDNPAYVETVSAAPPDILHVGHDVVFKSHLGPCRGTSAFPKPYERLSVEECKGEIDRVKDYVNALHRAGVQKVIPYICDVLIFGDHIERTGFWEFYDHWEEYKSLGFGERPPTDPIYWLQNDERRPLEGGAFYVYKPCINHPDWQRYLRSVVSVVARCGYDGVFVDVNSFDCSNECCRSLFSEYLHARYKPQALKRLFGFDTMELVRLGRDGEGLLAVETYRFRALSMAKLFAALRQEGESLRPRFLIVPNLSPMAHIDGVRKRIGNGQDVGRWATTVPWLMYEEMQQSGLFGSNSVSDCILQYKLASACGVRGGMLLYHATDPDGVALAMAEAGAGGGGGLIQPRYTCPEVRAQYKSFWQEHRELFEGLRPYSQVGVCYFRDELYWGNLDHLRSVYRIRRHLSDSHVLFDFIVEQNFEADTLNDYQAVIVPEIRHLSDGQVNALRRYVRRGGVLVVVRECGGYDELGKVLDSPALKAWPTGNKLDGAVPAYKVDKGYVMMAENLDTLVPSRAFELFDLSEDEANEFDVVMKRASNAPATPANSSPLVSELKLLAGRDISIANGMTPETVRFSAYTNCSNGGDLIAVHIVNYDVPIHGKGESGPPVAVDGLSVRVPVPTGRRVLSVKGMAPGEEFEHLKFAQADGWVGIAVTRVSIYKLLEIRCER